MKTTVDLDDDLYAELQSVTRLIGEKPETVLRLAIREGLPVLTKKLQTRSPEGYFTDACGDSDRTAFEQAMNSVTLQKPER